MDEFKKGDKVISTRIEIPSWLAMSRDKVYEVLAVLDFDTNPLIVFEDDIGHVVQWPAREFRLASGHNRASIIEENPDRLLEHIKVSLVDYTGKGSNDAEIYAAALLVFAKSTRLNMRASLFNECLAMDRVRLYQELDKIAATIPSSWEFVDYTFLIENVTRAFTHQLVRSRHFSFAQQAMRVVDVTGWQATIGPTIDKSPEARRTYCDAVNSIDTAYKRLVEIGASREDARGLLPTNIQTNIMCKMNMRGFVETYRKRTSQRVQDEYRYVMAGMLTAIKTVHPFISKFVERTKDNVIREMEKDIAALKISVDAKDKLLKQLYTIRAE